MYYGSYSLVVFPLLLVTVPLGPLHGHVSTPLVIRCVTVLRRPVKITRSTNEEGRGKHGRSWGIFAGFLARVGLQLNRLNIKPHPGAFGAALTYPGAGTHLGQVKVLVNGPLGCGSLQWRHTPMASVLQNDPRLPAVAQVPMYVTEPAPDFPTLIRSSLLVTGRTVRKCTCTTSTFSIMNRKCLPSPSLH